MTDKYAIFDWYDDPRIADMREEYIHILIEPDGEQLGWVFVTLLWHAPEDRGQYELHIYNGNLITDNPDHLRAYADALMLAATVADDILALAQAEAGS